MNNLPTAIKYKEIPKSLEGYEAEILWALVIINQAIYNSEISLTSPKEVGLKHTPREDENSIFGTTIASYDPNKNEIHYDPEIASRKKSFPTYLSNLLRDTAYLAPDQIEEFVKLHDRLNRSYALIHESYHALTKKQEGASSSSFMTRSIRNHNTITGSLDFFNTINGEDYILMEECIVDYFAEKDTKDELFREWNEGKISEYNIDDTYPRYHRGDSITTKLAIYNEQIEGIELRGYIREKKCLKSILLTIAAKYKVPLESVEKIAYKSLVDPESEGFYRLVFKCFGKSFAQYFFEKLEAMSKITNYVPEIFEADIES
jgi:hypothetical protein